MQPIHWFPGHMAKARREITESLRAIDVVMEILDARLPLASANPMLAEVLSNRPKVLVLTRQDLADENWTPKWIEYFRRQGHESVIVDARTGAGIKNIAPALERAAAAKRAKEQSRGIRPGAVRTMVVGIPNVGKSSVINRLAGRAAANVGDRPGITKVQQWIRLGNIQLLDTPGVLWPKLEDEQAAYALAITGAIKSDVLDISAVAAYLVGWLSRHYPLALQERFGITVNPFEWEGIDTGWVRAEPALIEIAKKRGFMRSGGVPDIDRAAELLLRETQTGKLGRLSFEAPPDAEMETAD